MEGWIVAATLITALAGLIASGAALWLAWQNQKLVRSGQEQVRVGQEQLSSQVRPVLVPQGLPKFQADHDNWLDWNTNDQPLKIRNMGVGTAFNVASVLCGCESYGSNDPTGVARMSDTQRTHWTCWLGVPIAPGETAVSIHLVGGSSFMQGNDHIGEYAFNAPDEPAMANVAMKGVLWRIARVTITYHDINGRAYASIFDYVHNRGWHMVALPRDIERDLHQLEGHLTPPSLTGARAVTSEDFPAGVV